MSPSSPGRRRLLIASAVIVLLLGAALALVIRHALSPGTLRPIAESQLSQVFGQPVTVGSLNIDLFPRVQVTGGNVAIGGGPTATAPSLRLSSVRIVPHLRPLLSGKLAIDLVELDGLSLAVRRDRERRWYLPFGAATGASSERGPGSAGAGAGVPPGAGAAAAFPSSAEGSAAASVDVGKIRLVNGRVTIVDDVLRTASGSPEVATLKDVTAKVAVSGGEIALDELTGKLGESVVKGTGRAGREGLKALLAWESLNRADLPEVFGLAGTTPIPGLAIDGRQPLDLELTVTPAGSIAAKGTVRADSIVLDTLTVSAATSPFAFNGTRLSADPATFRAYAGTGKARLGVELGPPILWSLDGRIDGLDVNAFLSANTSAKDQLSGTGQIAANVKGLAEGPVERSLTGTIGARITDGVIHDFALLAAINRAAGLTGGDAKDTKFEELSATLAVAGGRAFTRDLVLRAGEATVTAAGVLSFDRTLDFAGLVTLSRTKTAEVTAKAGELRALRNTQGELEIPLTVTGTTAAPNIQVNVAAVLQTEAKYQLKRQLDKTLKGLLKKR